MFDTPEVIFLVHNLSRRRNSYEVKAPVAGGVIITRKWRGKILMDAECLCLKVVALNAKLPPYAPEAFVHPTYAC